MKWINEKVNDIINHYNTRDPFEICEKMGIMVLKLKLPESTNGIYVNLNDVNTIILNNKLNYNKSKIVCAHELGHIILHDGTNSLDIERNTNYVLSKYEREADTFAACLLIDKSDIYSDAAYQARATVSEVSVRTGVPEALVELCFAI